MEPSRATGTQLGAGWPAQVADLVESVVGAVRDKGVRPATVVAKALVYGPLAALAGLSIVVLLAVGVVRALNQIPGFQDWISLAAVGGFFTVIGLFFLGRARAALKTPKG